MNRHLENTIRVEVVLIVFLVITSFVKGCNSIIFLKIVTFVVVDVLCHERYYEIKFSFQKRAKH